MPIIGINVELNINRKDYKPGDIIKCDDKLAALLKEHHAGRVFDLTPKYLPVAIYNMLRPR